MLYKVIDKPGLKDLFNAFLKEATVIAPVKQGKSYTFAPVDSFDVVELDYTTTVTSLKKFFIPKHETLFEFDETGEIQTCEIYPRNRVLFGAHPCDINAINNLDLVFEDPERPDPYYKKTQIEDLDCGHLMHANQDLFLPQFGRSRGKRRL